MASPPSAAAPSEASVGVIGAGVAGCALAARLRQLGWAGWIGLWEAGRGPGGRASTRRSRHDPGLAIDHGAPLFNISTSPSPQLMAPLRAGGWIEKWGGVCADLDGGGRLRQPSRDPLLAGELWRGCGGMDRIAHGLLELADSIGPVERRWGHRVRRLEQRPSGGWCLFDGDGEQLAEVDWLVLSGSLLAHPRATALLGWTEAPLREVAAGTDDPQLRAAVAGIGAIGWEARSNLLVLLPAPWAGPWRDLPFRLLACDADARMRWGLSRLAVQPLEDGRCALVAHSSADFAAQHGQVFGRGSAIAREIGCGPEAEAAVRTALTSSLQALLAPWLPAELAAAALATSEIRLMRWSAAFPQAPGLDPSLILCPASHLGFCGDYIAGPGFGRLEGAMRSAEALAERLLAGAAEEKGP